jgi:Protein of unknown function (DUF1329)
LESPLGSRAIDSVCAQRWGDGSAYQTTEKTVMSKRICLIALAMMLASTAAAWAQQFDRKAYDELVDASSPDTIPPGTKITLQNWTKYKRFMMIWMQVAFSGKMHFHIADTPDYVVEVQPTGDYPLPKAAREDSEKYAGQTKLVPLASTGGFGWEGYKAGIPFPNPQEPNRAAKIMYNIWAGSYTPFLLHEFSHNWETDSFGNVTPEDTDDSFYKLMGLSDPPYPQDMPDASGNIFANRFMQLTPEQARYTTALELISKDPSKMTEEYVFLPSLRRSLRLSSASRCTPILGTDYLADDTDWKPAFFKPEYYGEKKVLIAVADPKTAYTEGSRAGYVGGDYKRGAAFPGWPKPGYNHWEVRKVHIINMKPLPALGAGYCYSQRIFYVDAQTWDGTSLLENYDRNGKLYHINWSIHGPVEVQGDRTLLSRAFAFSLGMDWQNSHASPDIGYDLKLDKAAPAEYLESGIYTPGGLDRVMR